MVRISGWQNASKGPVRSVPTTSLGDTRTPSWSEDITWTVLPSTRRSPPGQAGFELHTVIRGVPFWGYDFDGLSADESATADAAGLPDDLFGQGAPPCVLSGDLPCVVEHQGKRVGTTVSFSLDVGPLTDPNAKALRLSTNLEGRTYDVVDDWFEDGVQRLENRAARGSHFRLLRNMPFL